MYLVERACRHNHDDHFDDYFDNNNDLAHNDDVVDHGYVRSVDAILPRVSDR